MLMYPYPPQISSKSSFIVPPQFQLHDGQPLTAEDESSGPGTPGDGDKGQRDPEPSPV